MAQDEGQAPWTAHDQEHFDAVQAGFQSGVGAVVLASAHLESVLGDVYAKLLQSPVAAVVAPGLGFEGTRQAIQAVVVALEHPDQDAILETLNAAKALYEDRNSVVHAGEWYAGYLNGPGVVHGPPELKHQHGHRRRKWKAVGDTRAWSAAELHALARDLGAVTNRLAGFVTG